MFLVFAISKGNRMKRDFHSKEELLRFANSLPSKEAPND
jgi:hypothetical protein